jgi:hypothetical protein
MTYDLRRLRLHGVIERVPRSFRYVLTADGLHLAFGISRIVVRLLQPGWSALLVPSPELPRPITAALAHLDDALITLAHTPHSFAQAA